jgi:hypothetical protein
MRGGFPDSERPRHTQSKPIHSTQLEKLIMVTTNLDERIHGIVLAAGEGKRLEPYVQEIIGEPLPKQYVQLIGNRSVLENACFEYGGDSTKIEAEKWKPETLRRRHENAGPQRTTMAADEDTSRFYCRAGSSAGSTPDTLRLHGIEDGALEKAPNDPRSKARKGSSMDIVGPVGMWGAIAVIACTLSIVTALSVRAGPSPGAAITAISVASQELFWARLAFRGPAVEEAASHLAAAWSRLQERQYQQSMIAARQSLERLGDIREECLVSPPQGTKHDSLGSCLSSR